jgi:hypothetical protein
MGRSQVSMPPSRIGANTCHVSEANMPYVSTAQRGYFNANRAKLEKQGVDVDEWNSASKGKKLPKRVKRPHRNGQISERAAAKSKNYGGKDDMNIPGATA